MDEAAVLALERPHKNLVTLYVLQALLTLVAFPVVIVPLYFRYHTLRYRLDEEGVSASWGILFRREVHLTYRRIQDIHVTRNIFERWLGIARVEIQTAAGSASAELTLEGIPDYEGVRDFLYARMRGSKTPAAAAAAGGIEPLLSEIRDDLRAAARALERLAG